MPERSVTAWPRTGPDWPAVNIGRGDAPTPPRQYEGPSTARYPLTGLLVCARSHPMTPAHREYRLYRCRRCGTNVDAELAEVVVWERVTRLRPMLAPATTDPTARGQILRTVLEQIRHGGAARFRVTWASVAARRRPCPAVPSGHRPLASSVNLP